MLLHGSWEHVCVGFSQCVTDMNCHLVRDIISCSLLFDKRDRRVNVAFVALSARSCERNSSNLPSDRQIATPGFFTQVSRNT